MKTLISALLIAVSAFAQSAPTAVSASNLGSDLPGLLNANFTGLYNSVNSIQASKLANNAVAPLSSLPVSLLPLGWQNIAAWGDSLTYGNQDGTATTYPATLTALSGRYVLNGGIGGNTSTQIRTRMLASTGTLGYFTVIWAGRNNYTDPTTVLADVAAMVAALPSPKRYLVLGVMNGNYPTELSGGSGYNQIISLNNSLAAAYSSNYLDMRAYLVSLATGSSQDQLDLSHDVPPASLRATWTGTLSTTINSSTCAFSVSTPGVLGTYDVITVGSEKIWVTGSSGNTASACTRGYAGTTAASHNSGDALTRIDALHPTAGGYSAAALRIWTWMQANEPNYLVGSRDIARIINWSAPGDIGSVAPANGKFGAVSAGTGSVGNQALTILEGPNASATFATDLDFVFKLTSPNTVGLQSAGGIVFYPGYGIANPPVSSFDQSTGDLILGGKVRIPTCTPASSSAAGVADSLCRDGNYIYVATATNTWKRAALTTW